MKEKIFVALSTFGEYGSQPLDMLKESAIEFDVNKLGRRLVAQEIIDMGANASGIIAGVEPYNEYVLKCLTNLRCISRAGVGTDAINLDFARKRNIEIRNTPDVVVRPVVELTLAMMFDLLRKTTLHTVLLKTKRWEKVAGNLLQGKTVGLVGAGRIGKAVGEVLVKLDANVIVHDIVSDEEWARKTSIRLVAYSNLLGNSDIISLHASPAGGSKVLIGKKEISLMKTGVMIINTSRGAFIDEEALYDGLSSGKIGSVGLDVFPEEPYHGKLTEFDNVVLTPHLATLTKESRLQMEIEATQNLLKFFGV